MKENLKRILSLIQEIDKTEKREKFNLLKNRMTNEIFDFYTNASRDKFITVIKLKVLQPLQNSLTEASNFVETKKSRSFVDSRRKMLIKRDFLIDLRNQILIDYKEELNNLEHFKQYLIEKARNRFLILNPTQGYPIIDFTPRQLKSILKKSFDEVVDFFENKQLTNTNYKEELYSFVKKAKREINNISKELKLLKKKHTITKEEQIDILIDISQEIKLLSLHSDYLLKLTTELEKTHFFLKIYTPKEETPLTVFGDRNENKLEQLFFKLKVFLENTVEREDIVNVFSINFEVEHKINLVNGTLNDFAHLINEMMEHFTPEISNKANYNQWWADRFTFNGADKQKKGITTMRSNTKKDVTRKSQQTSKIDEIICVLK